jgi:competence protein ComEC
VDWPATWASITVLTLLCLLLAWLAPAVLARPWPALATALCAAVVVTVPVPAVGWPPPGWVLVACDVGQGDGLVLDAGGGAAVVVDVGPDPVAIASCLDRLEVERVRQVVLTHFHADHVGGLTGLLREHRPEAVLVTALGEPPESAARVHAVAAAAGVPVRVATVGAVSRSGPLTWQVLGPAVELAAGSAAGNESAANNASVVLLARSRGVTMLLTGDVEPEAQRLLATLLGGRTVDVLKVPHHGSRYQHPELLTGLRPRVAVVSVGEDNDYGHPAPETLTLLARVGALVARTDASGDVAVLVDEEGRLAVRTRR